MISRLNKKEFYERLKASTKKGCPSIKATPFLMFSCKNDSLKRFYGEYSKSKFRLTENRSFLPVSYIIEGNYKSKGNSKSLVEYKLVMIKYAQTMMWLIPIGIFLMLNFSLIPSLDKPGIDSYIGYNMIVLGFILFFIILARVEKKNLKTNFNRVFEIE